MAGFPFRVFSATALDGSTAAQTSDGAIHSVFCWGTFDGATVKVQLSPDGTEWFDVTELTFDAKADTPINYHFAPGVQVRGNISSAGGSTAINLLIA